jgi:hypothetical protein
VVAVFCRAGCYVANSTCKDGVVVELDAFVCLKEAGTAYFPYMRNFSSMMVVYSHGQWPTRAYYRPDYYVNGSCSGDLALRGYDVKLGECGPANMTLQGLGQVYGVIIKVVPVLPSPSPSTPSATPSATPSPSASSTSLPLPSPSPSPSPLSHGGDGGGFPVWAIVVLVVGGAVVVAGLASGVICLAKRRRSTYQYIA